MSYDKCPTCKEYAFFSIPGVMHRCPPAWECRLEWIKDDPDAWETVHAESAETAAAKYAERYDSTGGEHAIVRNGSAQVDVRKPDEDGYQRYVVEAETVPHYRASPE